MLTLKIEGYTEAKRILDELPNTMQKRMLSAALRASAKPMLQSARSKVPVRTGKLKKQLRTVRYKDRNASKSEVAIAVKPVPNSAKLTDQQLMTTTMATLSISFLVEQPVDITDDSCPIKKITAHNAPCCNL